jgi:hypothetical protein
MKSIFYERQQPPMNNFQLLDLVAPAVKDQDVVVSGSKLSRPPLL